MPQVVADGDEGRGNHTGIIAKEETADTSGESERPDEGIW